MASAKDYDLALTYEGHTENERKWISYFVDLFTNEIPPYHLCLVDLSKYTPNELGTSNELCGLLEASTVIVLLAMPSLANSVLLLGERVQSILGNNVVLADVCETIKESDFLPPQFCNYPQWRICNFGHKDVRNVEVVEVIKGVIIERLARTDPLRLSQKKCQSMIINRENVATTRQSPPEVKPVEAVYTRAGPAACSRNGGVIGKVDPEETQPKTLASNDEQTRIKQPYTGDNSDDDNQQTVPKQILFKAPQ